MNVVRQLRAQVRATQAELARAAGTSQPTVAAYEAGTKSPTLRTLERMARAVGLDVAVSFLAPMTREERRSLLLHAAIATRLEEDPGAVLHKARANLRRMREVNPFAAPLLNEWRRILQRAVPQIVDVLTDPRPHARELRHVTPFAGVLTASERVDVYARFRAIETAA